MGKLGLRGDLWAPPQLRCRSTEAVRKFKHSEGQILEGSKSLNRERESTIVGQREQNED